MASIRTLNFSKEMSNSSSTIYSDKLITVEKLLTKRQAIHKHMSLVVSAIHGFMFFICLLNDVFLLTISPVKPNQRVNECTVLGIADLFMYTASNLLFFFYFLTLWFSARSVSELSNNIMRYIDYQKYFYLLPLQIITTYFVSKNICSNNTLSFTYNSIMTMHLFMEIFVVTKYMNWFQREVLSIENHEYFDDCKKSWDMTSKVSVEKI